MRTSGKGLRADDGINGCVWQKDGFRRSGQRLDLRKVGRQLRAHGINGLNGLERSPALPEQGHELTGTGTQFEDVPAGSDAHDIAQPVQCLGRIARPSADISRGTGLVAFR